MAQAPQAPSLYPTDELYFTGRVEYNVDEIKKYQFPDSIVSYLNYFERWTPRLSGDERKILLNKLLQEDDIAFSIYMDNLNESYESLKSKLIDQLTECGESLLENKKEKIKRKRMFKRMSLEEKLEFVRSTYNELNSLPKERLVLKELTRVLPRKFKKLDLENKCNTVDQVIEQLGEKLNKMKLKERSNDGEKKKFKLKKKHLLRRRGSSTSSTSSESSEDEKHKKKDHHHKKGKDHSSKEKGFGGL